MKPSHNTPSRKKLDLLQGELTILLISPQLWDGFQVSKHHYAMELAKLGHRVFFVNPPQITGKPGSISIRDIKGHDRIKVLDYCPWFPYRVKFHARWFFNWAMRRQAKLLIDALPVQPDIVWDFDNTYNFVSLMPFGAKLKIFHAVDQLVHGQSSAKDADVVLAVAESTLKNIDTRNIGHQIVGHGLSTEYTEYGRQRLSQLELSTEKMRLRRVGFVGNLLNAAVDGSMIMRIVVENPKLVFEFFGPYETVGSGSTSPDWVKALFEYENTKFHGLCTQCEIIKQAPNIDVWLLCYDNQKDINNGADSHKVLEYLATGSPVVSSHLDAYQDTGLLSMPASKTNDDLPCIFQEIKTSLKDANDSDCKRRIEFSLARTYSNRLGEIAKHISKQI